MISASLDVPCYQIHSLIVWIDVLEEIVPHSIVDKGVRSLTLLLGGSFQNIIQLQIVPYLTMKLKVYT